MVRWGGLVWLLRVGFDLSWICCKNANSYIALLILSKKKSYNKVAFSPCSYSPPQFLIWSTSCRKEWLTTWLLGQQKLWVVIHWQKHSSRAWVDLHTLVFVSFYFIFEILFSDIYRARGWGMFQITQMVV